MLRRLCCRCNFSAYFTIHVFTATIRAISDVSVFKYAMLTPTKEMEVNMKKEKLKYSVISNSIFLLKDMWSEYPLLIFYLVLQVILSVLSPLFSMLLPKITLDLVLEGAETVHILAVLGGFGIVMALSMGLSQMAADGRYMMYNNMRVYYQKKLFFQSLHCDYRIIGSAEGQKKYHQAIGTTWRGDMAATSKLTVGMVDILIAVLSFVIYSGVIATLHIGVLLMLVLVSLLQYAATKRAREYEQKNRFENGEIQKKIWYLDNVNHDMTAGKDIRLYHMGNWFLQIWNNCIRQKTAWNEKIRNRYAMAEGIGAFLLFLRDGIAYVYLIWSVLNGQIVVSDFVMYFAAITGFSGFIGRIVKDVNTLHTANVGMNDLRAFLDETDEPEPEDPVDISTLKDRTIEFRHVTFSYQEGIEPALKDISFTIKQGEKIALVGVNGAGKTTIVKLLCGFYKPEKGQILIGGVDSRRFRKEDLYSLYAAVFQDIYLPPYTVAENISMKPRKHTDTARVERCLKEAGIYEKIREASTGIDTPIGREIEEGMMFSGGQKQKLLMARALYKDAPLLILDEPTAALDPIAESETYESFRQLAKDKTAIFISHRLASTRFCDRILLLGEGRVLESGTHEELLAMGGEYTKMFEMQSHYYTKTGGAQHE